MGPKPKNNLIHRLTGALISHVITPSEIVKHELQKFSWLKDKITVIHNGITITPRPSDEQIQAARAMLGLPNDKFLCLYVGRLMTGKGIDTLIEAFAKVNQEIPAAVLWIVGTGPSDGTAREKVATLSLTGVVSFVGYSTEPSVYFTACDLFILPSRYESFSYVLLEAMLHAKPCVTTRAGAIPEVVGEDAAVLVPPANADALANAVAKLIGDDQRRTELAAKGRERVIDHFDLNKTVDAVESLFRTTMKTA